MQSPIAVRARACDDRASSSIDPHRLCGIVHCVLFTHTFMMFVVVVPLNASWTARVRDDDDDDDDDDVRRHTHTLASRLTRERVASHRSIAVRIDASTHGASTHRRTDEHRVRGLKQHDDDDCDANDDDDDDARGARDVRGRRDVARDAPRREGETRRRSGRSHDARVRDHRHRDPGRRRKPRGG